MAITTQILGLMGGESYMFEPDSGTRYYLPKGKYQMIVVRLGGSTGTIGHKASNQSEYSSRTSSYSSTLSANVSEVEIEWVEFTGPIWSVLIAPRKNLSAVPATTPF